MIKTGFGADKTTYDNVDWMGFGVGSNLACIDVKDGKILRTRPFRYDAEYTEEELKPFTYEKDGKVFKLPMHNLIPPTSAAYKRHAFSRNRVPYPLKRVDWDPEGDRHPETRGISKYERISWDEATTIIAKEVKRQFDLYGAGTILAQQDGHGETKVVHASHGCMVKLLDLLGGCTIQARQPDSWEGWYWGAKHAWGGEPYGQAPMQNVVWDIVHNAKMALYWGCDNETTTWGWTGQLPSRLSFYFRDIGIFAVSISPDLNYSGAVHADRWIPVYPNTDLALQMGIAYVWLTEGLYDREYVDTHVVGFDWVEAEIYGHIDGIVKTPEWAEERCGVPARVIKALARKWANDPTYTFHCNGGSFIRSCYSHEPARMEVMLHAMQGIGKPGRGGMKFIEWMTFGLDKLNPLPTHEYVFNPSPGYNGAPLSGVERFIPKTMIPQGLLAEPGKEIDWHGHVICSLPASDQFLPFEYPLEGEQGVHMIWSDTPCWSTCWNDGNAYLQALRNPNLEFVLLQHPWFENDAKFADIVLPSNTRYENRDVCMDAQSGFFGTFIHCEQEVEPYGESKSDWFCVCEVAKKMEELFAGEGRKWDGIYERYTGGRDVEKCIHDAWEHGGIAELMSYEDWIEKGYVSSPMKDGWEKRSCGMEDFYKDPENFPLETPTGKIEAYSTGLAANFPDDDERRPYVQYIADSPRFHEYRESEKAKKYPYLIISNHPRWRIHANFDDNSWLREIETCKVIGPDGYAYEPAWLNPADAEKLGVQNGDVVKIYNDRGWVLGGVYVTERIIEGVVLQDHGARIDPIEPGVSDRAGANNLIAPLETTSKNAAGEVTSGYLVGVEKVDVFELAKQYPEAFSRTFQADEGVDLSNFIVDYE